jgi:hypothetical protein
VPAPPWVREIDAIMLGSMLGFGFFAAVKAARQTYWCWRRLHGRLTSYILMIWICLGCGITQCCISYAYQGQKIQPSFWLFFFQGEFVSLDQIAQDVRLLIYDSDDLDRTGE